MIKINLFGADYKNQKKLISDIEKFLSKKGFKKYEINIENFYLYPGVIDHIDITYSFSSKDKNGISRKKKSRNSR